MCLLNQNNKLKEGRKLLRAAEWGDNWLYLYQCYFSLRLCRKLLREHQLESVTKAAQQGELERRRRLEEQRKQDFPVPLLPEYTTGKSRYPPPKKMTFAFPWNCPSASNVFTISCPHLSFSSFLFFSFFTLLIYCIIPVPPSFQVMWRSMCLHQRHHSEKWSRSDRKWSAWTPAAPASERTTTRVTHIPPLPQSTHTKQVRDTHTIK